MNAPEDPIQTPPPPPAPGYKRCPYCAEETPGNEEKCAHCDEFVDGREPPYRGELSWYEKQMINTSKLHLLIVFAVMNALALRLWLIIVVAVNVVGLILGLIGVLICKPPEARKTAKLILVVSGIATVVAILYMFVKGINA